MNTRSLLLLFTIILVTTISVSAQPVQMEVVPTSLEFLNGPASQTISLHFSSISESVSWWVTTQDDSANWFTVTPDSGNGSEETVQLTVSIHSYEFPFEIFDLPGEVVIHGMNTTPDTITIPILLHFLGFTDPGSVDENWMATPYSIHLLNINDSLTWTATTSSNWFTVHPDSGIGSNWITGAISENDSISSRRGCIVIGFNFTHPRIDTVWVTQGGRIPCQLTVSPTSWTINDYHAASHTFQINDGGGTMIPDWNIPYDASWITCTPWHGIGNDIITALADENPDSAGRTATITIIDNHSVPDTVMITVFQPVLIYLMSIIVILIFQHNLRFERSIPIHSIRRHQSSMTCLSNQILPWMSSTCQGKLSCHLCEILKMQVTIM